MHTYVHKYIYRKRETEGEEEKDVTPGQYLSGIPMV